jgi:HEAT repeat protein
MENTMTEIRNELIRYIRLNEEQWIPTSKVLEQLDERFDDLIPHLIESLTDGHPEIRHLAVQLLAAARPRSDVAVSALIERMTDEDWLVVTATMHVLGDFEQLAVAAVPQIEEWLESPNEYLRVLAAITVLKIDPSRIEFLPDIREAMNSDHPVASDIARDFFDGTMR